MSLEAKLESGADCDYPEALTYWRSLPARAFDAALRHEVEMCVREIGATDRDWRAALAGDAEAACALALRLPVDGRITFRSDLVMTVLLFCAFDDADAALVMSERLQRMPIEPPLGLRLAASWLVLAEPSITNTKG